MRNIPMISSMLILLLVANNFASEGKFFNKTKSTIKIALNVALGSDKELTLAPKSCGAIDFGLHKIHGYTVHAFVVNDEDAHDEEVVNVERGRYGSFECTIFTTKDADPSNPCTEKLTYWCAEKGPIQGKEFTRFARHKK